MYTCAILNADEEKIIAGGFFSQNIRLALFTTNLLLLM